MDAYLVETPKSALITSCTTSRGTAGNLIALNPLMDDFAARPTTILSLSLLVLIL